MTIRFEALVCNGSLHSTSKLEADHTVVSYAFIQRLKVKAKIETAYSDLVLPFPPTSKVRASRTHRSLASRGRKFKPLMRERRKEAKEWARR